ncbi:hypothetical protein ASE16_04845 [Leifsonia sp. Root227]|uniref:ROK family protein n=1 Tax=Leifsonia sp. Root227 TaxID=1736496 RepID=UPI0006F7F2CD|nr:ROK family protein [Leifsonia sp. Root227]KRC52356.1 hypothetical protein ASE16_04845 [Leifsonia sp. Root227]
MTAAELRHDHLSIIRALSGAEQSRADLGRTLGWARNTVSSRLDDLLAGGWIVESGDQLSGRGRPSALFRLNEDNILVFVASFGKDQVTATIATIGGAVLARSVIDGYSLGAAGSDGPADAARLRDELVAEAGVSAELIRIAVVGVTGPVEDNKSMPMYADLTVDGASFERALGIPVVVENDANLMALGLLPTLDAQSRSLVFVKVATGIGAGLIIDGRLHRGLRGLAGELGHIPVAHGDGIPCNCGNYGCVGEVASAPAILNQVRNDGLDVASLDELQPLVAAGNQIAIATLRQAGRDIGEAMIGLVTAIAPDVLVMGGRVVGLGDHLMTGLRETLYSRALPATTSRLRIESIRDAEDAAVRGALVMGFDRLFPHEPSATA